MVRRIGRPFDVSKRIRHFGAQNKNQTKKVKMDFAGLSPLEKLFSYAEASDADKFCENIGKLWLNEKTADIYFIINDEQRFPAHKCLLAADSSVFYRRFFVESEEASNIHICDVSIDGFKVFLSSFYQPSIVICDQNISELIYLSKQYAARNCMTQCEQFLKAKLTADNVCYAFELATVCNDMAMYRSCLMVIEKHFLRVLTSDGFLLCSQNVLKHILLSNIRNRDEFAMFEACMHWAKTNFDRRNKEHSDVMDWRIELGECFDLIRFGSMTPLQFMKCETIYPVFSPKELTDIKLRIIALNNNTFST